MGACCSLVVAAAYDRRGGEVDAHRAPLHEKNHVAEVRGLVMFEPMRLLAWFLGLAGVILAIWALWGDGLEAKFSLDGAVAYLDQAGGFAWLLGWALLVSDVVLPVPGTVVMSALGFVYGAVIGGVLAAAGSVLAGLTAYGMCRLLGERGAKWLLGEKDFERGKRWFANGGGWLVCLSRSLPILPEVVACTAGLVRMPFKRFVVSLVCGSLPLGLVFASIGAAGRDEPALAMALSLALPAILWGVARLLMRRLEKRSEER